MSEGVLVLGGSRGQRVHAARAHLPSAHHAIVVDSGTLPFIRAGGIALPPSPRVVIVDDIERAFPDAQTAGVRLVLTQPTYLLQTWIDRLDEGDRIIATADRAALERCAPEALQRRGPWFCCEIVDLDDDRAQALQSARGERVEPRDFLAGSSFDELRMSGPEPSGSTETILSIAFASSNPAERLRLCREAADQAPESAVAALALASACRESRDGGAARAALDRAAVLAPEWEAIAYESGKLWLVYDDLAKARDAFQRAADLMPAFAAALGNLGATLGELGEPAAALAAFRQALAHDPRSFTILNNIGASCRELGRLDESETAFRQVIEIDPSFVFGHYNLGHTLFLAGRYRDALAAYEEGRRRDPQQNRRQGCRLAVVRFANGDGPGAEREFWRCLDGAPADEREDLLLEAYEIAHALLAQHPALEPHRPVLERIGAEIAKSE
jgi:tetratricopeptide (TPR) repeat protein